MKDRTALAIAAMAFVTTLETFALMRGINGAALAAVIALLAGLGGYALPHRKR